ncbi:2TM domain-containing protein [Xylophilus sp. GW821-FHT01B05]
MTPHLSPDEIEQLASRRAGAKLGWFVHAAIYVLVNLTFFLLSLDSGRHRWSFAPALGWGFGLLLHGLSVWVLGQGSGLRERLVQRERERLLQQQDRR